MRCHEPPRRALSAGLAEAPPVCIRHVVPPMHFVPLRSVRTADDLPAAGPFSARIACARERAFRVGARFARLIARARAGGHRTHVCRSFLRGFFRTGAKQETKRPADAASSCPILPQFSLGQPRSRNYIGFHEQKTILGHGLDPAIPPATVGLASGRSPRPHGFGRGPPDTTPKRGRPERHPYELILQPEEIEHRTGKVRRLHPNGFVEFRHRTLLDKQFRIMGRKKLHESIEAMQTNLDAYLVRYNTEQLLHGRGMNRRRPSRLRPTLAGAENAKGAAEAANRLSQHPAKSGDCQATTLSVHLMHDYPRILLTTARRPSK